MFLKPSASSREFVTRMGIGYGKNDILMAHLDEFYPEDTTYEIVEWGVAGLVGNETGSVDREYLGEFDLEHYEVVGNIFDNKELLQEEYK